MKKELEIAIIDDEALFREGVSNLIRVYSNMRVVYSADSSENLLEVLAGDIAFPDIFILDLKMKPLDGIETTKVLKKNYPESRIIILSSYYSPSFINYMVRLGVNAFLPKSTDPKELIIAIEMVYEKGLYFTKEYAEAVRVQNLQMPRKPHFKNAEGITKKELEILNLVCHGYSNQQVAEKTHRSVQTIEEYRQHLLDKTGAKNNAGLVVFALMHGLVDVDKKLLDYTIAPKW